jgi:hypothetical protein
MPLPAVLAGIGSALSNPTFLSIVGGLLPSVVSALTGSPTEDEAKAKFAPKREEMLNELINAGMERSEAERLADEAIATDVQGAMASGGIPPWLEGAAAVGGGILGWKSGNWLRGRASSAAPAAAAASTPTVPTKVAESPFMDTTSATREVNPLRDPNRTMLGHTTEQRTLTPEEMPTADLPVMGSPFVAARKGSPFSWKGEAEAPPMFTDMDTPPVPRRPIREAAPEVAEPGRDPMAWADGVQAERMAQEGQRIGSPFAWADDLQLQRRAEAARQGPEAIARRQALDEIAAAEAAAKPRQIGSMFNAQEIQMNRGREL